MRCAMSDSTINVTLATRTADASPQAGKKPVRHLPPPVGLKERLVRSRYSLVRHLVQVTVLLLFIATARWGLTIANRPVLDGTLSNSKILGAVPLTDPFAMLERLAAGHLPTLSALIGAGIVVGLYGLLGSRIFCGWICPMNLVTEAADWVRRRLGFQADVMRFDNRLRYAFALVTLVASFFTGTAAFETVSPQALLWRDLVFGTGLWAVAAALGVFALDVAVARQGWCGHLCPLGAFWALIGRLNPKPYIKIKFDTDSCTRCGDCIRVCPEPQIIRFKELSHTGQIPRGECLQCGRCIQICPEDSLAFQLGKRMKIHDVKGDNHERL